MGLWVRAGSWSMQHMTDGRIPKDALRTMGTRGQAERLVKAGLWHVEPDGYSFHDWSTWQPTKEQVEKRRAEGARRLREWRAAKAAEREGKNGAL